MCSCSAIPNLAVLRVNKTGLPGQKKFKRPNLSISSFKKAKSSNMKKGQIPNFFQKFVKTTRFKFIIFFNIQRRPNHFLANRFKKAKWHTCCKTWVTEVAPLTPLHDIQVGQHCLRFEVPTKSNSSMPNQVLTLVTNVKFKLLSESIENYNLDNNNKY